MLMKPADLPASIVRTFSLPQFWDGVAKTRDELRDPTGAMTARRIRAALGSTPLRQIPEFRQWRAIA